MAVRTAGIDRNEEITSLSPYVLPIHLCHCFLSERGQQEQFSVVQFAFLFTQILCHLSMQTFLECVRLRTFGRYGLQQIQVDTHYLQLYLWRFVADEKYTFRALIIFRSTL